MANEKEIWVDDKRLAEKFGAKFTGDERQIIKVKIEKLDDLKRAEEAERAGAKRLFVQCPNWKVIPLENLLALCKKAKIIVEVKNANEAKTALQTLEKGASGVLLSGAREEDVQEVLAFVAGGEKVALVPGKITNVKKLPTGARSCIDTMELMREGEGMLVGASSSAFFLMRAEVEENPHVATRPFRVNAGAVSLYILLPGGKTKYLNEVEAGDEVLVISREGETRKATVVRNKIEWRPMLLLEADVGGRKVKTIAQDAETIRVLTPSGSASVAELKKGDVVLVKVEEERARHFGMKVEEQIIEK